MRDVIVGTHYNEARVADYLILLTAEYIRENGKWVGVCLELGTSTFADTLDQVREELSDAVSLQLGETQRLGFLDEYLEDHAVIPRKMPSEVPISGPGLVLAG